MRHRPLSSPVLLISENNCVIAIGNTPVTTFTMDRLNEGLLYLMAYYYALLMTYPKCISTLLSVVQTEVHKDSIHEQDLTPHYKKAIGEWKSFSEWGPLFVTLPDVRKGKLMFCLKKKCSSQLDTLLVRILFCGILCCKAAATWCYVHIELWMLNAIVLQS